MDSELIVEWPLLRSCIPTAQNPLEGRKKRGLKTQRDRERERQRQREGERDKDRES